MWIALSLVLLASPAAQRVERLARQDLAKKLTVDERKIETKSVKPTTWPDASLGCPEAGKMYAQMETPGFLIELASGGKTYRYHADRKRVVTCDQPL